AGAPITQGRGRDRIKVHHRPRATSRRGGYVPAHLYSAAILVSGSTRTGQPHLQRASRFSLAWVVECTCAPARAHGDRQTPRSLADLLHCHRGPTSASRLASL